jgi:hypothetical protein
MVCRQNGPQNGKTKCSFVLSKKWSQNGPKRVSMEERWAHEL